MQKQRLIFLLAGSLAALFCRSAAPPPALAADATVQLETTCTHYVALTFDDGPQPENTARLLDGLRQRGASATFFLVGEQLAGNEALVRRMRDEGHQVGNHTWSHVKLQGASKDTATREVEQTDAALRQILGDGTYDLRPPYGLLGKEQCTLFSVPLIKWSVDPEDWRLRNREQDVAAVLSAVQPGDIILMHDSVAASVDAALDIVDALEPQGYCFVTVEELLALYDTEVQNGVLYCSATSTESGA